MGSLWELKTDNRHRSVCNQRTGSGKLVLQQDMVAIAVQLASIVITNHRGNIRNGHSEMEEFNLAANMDISENNHNLKHQGWARRPQQEGYQEDV